MTKPKTKIFVAIPSLGSVSDLHPYCFRQYERDYGDQIEFVWPKDCVHRKLHDFARNCLVEEFLKSDADMMWFLDSDVAPPPHVLDLVTKYSENWDLAGAPYPVFMTPPGYNGPQIVMCVYDQGGKGLHVRDVPKSGTKFVDGMATGCIFIKREVFAKLKKPYFEFKFDPETRIMTEGEDLGFCRKVNALGYKFFTDFTMVCAHYKQVNLLDVNNYAIQYAHSSVQMYDAQIRDQIDALVAKVTTPKQKSSLILPK